MLLFSSETFQKNAQQELSDTIRLSCMKDHQKSYWTIPIIPADVGASGARLRDQQKRLDLIRKCQNYFFEVRYRKTFKTNYFLTHDLDPVNRARDNKLSFQRLEWDPTSEQSAQRLGVGPNIGKRGQNVKMCTLRRWRKLCFGAIIWSIFALYRPRKELWSQECV